MRNRVTVISEDSLIIIDDIPLQVNFYPDKYFHAIQWYKGKGHIEYGEGQNKEIAGEEDYNTYILPYVDLFLTEKASLEQEKQKAEEIYNSLPKVKERKLAELKLAFQNEEQSGFVESSLGFKADATRTSKQDIDGLIQTMETTNTENIMFRDYSNEFHILTLPQLKILQLEIIKKGLDLYQKKWTLEQLATTANTKEELEAIQW